MKYIFNEFLKVSMIYRAEGLADSIRIETEKEVEAIQTLNESINLKDAK
jgi:hypothetical protein